MFLVTQFLENHFLCFSLVYTVHIWIGVGNFLNLNFCKFSSCTNVDETLLLWFTSNSYISLTLYVIFNVYLKWMFVVTYHLQLFLFYTLSYRCCLLSVDEDFESFFHQ